MRDGTSRKLAGALTGAMVLVASTLAALALMAAVAQAATVTLGADLSLAPSISSTCTSTEGCAAIITEASSPSSATQAMEGGTVRSWSLEGGSAVPGYSVSVMKKVAAGIYTITAVGEPVSPTGSQTQTFAADLPIAAGEYVALNFPEDGAIGTVEGSSTIAVWETVPTLGETATARSEAAAPFVPAFNFELEPTGSTTNTTTTTSTATTAPATTTPAAVPHCVVPKLAGRTLKAARKALASAGCKVGFVIGPRSKGARHRPTRVRRVAPRAGLELAPGAEVSLRLG